MQAEPLQVRQSKGAGYLVIATTPSGLEQELDGFATENAAQEWIANEGSAWLARNPHFRQRSK
jgi:hypothetical protein